MEYIPGCKNNYTKENIDALFCESEEAQLVCETCPNFVYNSRLGEITCRLLNDMNLEER